MAAYVRVLMYGSGTRCNTAKWKHSLEYFGLSHLSLWEDAVKPKPCVWFGYTFTSLFKAHVNYLSLSIKELRLRNPAVKRKRFLFMQMMSYCLIDSQIERFAHKHTIHEISNARQTVRDAALRRPYPRDKDSVRKNNICSEHFTEL